MGRTLKVLDAGQPDRFPEMDKPRLARQQPRELQLLQRQAEDESSEKQLGPGGATET